MDIIEDMVSSSVKHILKVVFVVIVIAGLVLSYLFIGAPTQPVVEEPTAAAGWEFKGPTTEPVVNGPTEEPNAVGPSGPPPTQ